jgi:hypothetical protein
VLEPERLSERLCRKHLEANSLAVAEDCEQGSEAGLEKKRAPCLMRRVMGFCSVGSNESLKDYYSCLFFLYQNSMWAL